MWGWWRRWRARRRAGETVRAPDDALAERWVRTRDPALRATVLATGAVAAPDPAFRPERDDGSALWYVVDYPMLPHLVTLALHGRLAQAPAMGVARAVGVLLVDPDPDVVAAARSFALAATGPVLSVLWRANAFRHPVYELLLRIPEPIPDDALDVAWELWLTRPDRRLWDKLDGRPATGAQRRPSRIVLGLATPAETCAAALSGGSSDVLVAHAVAICRDRGYAPDDPAARAALFVLTGQVARYRDIDPDSAHLARAYQRAPQRLRRRLRAALSEIEGVDLVRVLTGDPRRTLTGTERQYLVRALSGRRAWADLWRVVLALPLAEAVKVARRFDGWRPPGPRDQALFDRLRAVTDRHLRQLPPPARALFDRRPAQLRKALPKYLWYAEPVLTDLVRARLDLRAETATPPPGEAGDPEVGARAAT